ncbi:MAG: hypothetical protein NT137_04490 [Methanomassiliicoccales archaeon]|nr:hypothetical protein [Methanomassiliicoccales archaeon]
MLVRETIFLYVLGAAFVLLGFLASYVAHVSVLGIGFFLMGAWMFLMPSMRQRYG